MNRRPGLQACEAITFKEFLVIIGAKSGGINAPSVVKQDAGFFMAGGTEANEFHMVLVGVLKIIEW